MRMDDPRLPERFWDKVSPEPNSGCWLWIGFHSRSGYARLGQADAYRLAYKTLVGGEVSSRCESGRLVLDHLCRVRGCVNPEHLELVPERVNIMRGVSVTSINASKTHCVNGHALSPDNTYIYAYKYGFKRDCRVCLRAAQKRQRVKKAGGRHE